MPSQFGTSCFCIATSSTCNICFLRKSSVALTGLLEQLAVQSDSFVDVVPHGLSVVLRIMYWVLRAVETLYRKDAAIISVGWPPA